MPPKSSPSSAASPASGAGKPPKSVAKGSSGGKKKESSGASNADFLKTEDVLQAVLLADSFQVKFRPLTQQKPKVLLPLLNIPLLEYSLEFLVSGGVGEIFVFCSSHAAAIQQYLDSDGSKWKRRKGVVIKTVMSKDCFSFGDAMRYLDSLDVIKNDFVLMYGDVIANLKLASVVKAHKERVAQDKRNLMTLIYKQASATHRTRPLGDDAVLAVEPNTMQLLQYENDRTKGRVALDQTLLAETKSALQLRYDLMDAHISVCTPEVLMLFTDNFDWQTFHTDFLMGVLGSEILGNKIFLYIISRDEYAARCEDLRTYDSLSKDVIHRWTYPMVPDTNLLSNTTYKYQRGNIYKEDGVSISREAKIGAEVTIGSGTTIASKAEVKSTVIGRNCTVGKGASVVGSYLWNNVTVEEGAIIDHAILADGVVVGAGARLGRGVILSFGVKIGANHVVPPYTKITTLPEGIDDERGEGAAAESSEEEDEEDHGKKKKSTAASPTASASASASPDATQVWNSTDVGVGGIGRLYHEEDANDDDLDDDDAADSPLARFPYSQNELNSIAPNPRAVQAWLRLQLEEESEDEWAEIDEATVGNEDEEDDEADPSRANQLGASAYNQNFHKFCEEAAETLKRGHKEKLALDDISLEMNALKFSHNTTVEEFAHAAFLGLFSIVNEQINPKSNASAVILDASKNKTVMQVLGTLFKQWWKILGKFGKLESDQVFMLQGLEQACLASGFVSNSIVSPSNAALSSSAGNNASIYTLLFTPTLQLLYNNFQLFSEDAIFKWAEKLEDSEGPDHILLKQSEPFRTWLAEAEEEEDEEEED